MDGLLVIEFPMDNFVLVSQTESSLLVFGKTLSVIMNSYMHSFMQRLEYQYIPVSKKIHDLNIMDGDGKSGIVKLAH